jgi:hypothetical protein
MSTSPNVMAERMWHYYRDSAPHRIYNSTSPGRYRNEIADVCPDCALIRDVAEGFKHVHLSRPGRLVTRADQTGAGKATWTNDAGQQITWTNMLGEGVAWVTAVLVRRDDGSEVPLLPALVAVVAMWDRLTAA